jgi:uncharacterized protein YjbK
MPQPSHGVNGRGAKDLCVEQEVKDQKRGLDVVKKLLKDVDIKNNFALITI